MSTKQYISFSQLRTYNECPARYKIQYIDGLKGDGSIHTAFGSAVHAACEFLLADIPTDGVSSNFRKIFNKELDELTSEYKTGELVEWFAKQKPSMDYDEGIEWFYDQGIRLIPEIMPFMRKTFGNFETLHIEEELMESVTELPLSKRPFRGFIDAVIKTEDGKIHVIDWKTCSWGWPAAKKGNTLNSYQLTLYKKFLAEKHGLDVKNIETYFCLLKRTAKKDIIELVRITSGDLKTKNAVNLLTQTMHNIDDRGFFIKNLSACKWCQFENKECVRDWRN